MTLPKSNFVKHFGVAMLNRRYILFRMVLFPILAMCLITGFFCARALAAPIRPSADDFGIIFVIENPDGQPDFKGAPFHTKAVDPVKKTILIPRGQRVRVEGKAPDGRLLVTVIDLPEDIGTGSIEARYLAYIGMKSSFRDVADDHWAASSIAALAKDGIVQGYRNNFMGDKSFSRYEMAVILAPLLKQFREMQNTLTQLQATGTFVGSPDGSSDSGTAQTVANNEIQIAQLIASIGTLRAQIEKQSDRLVKLERSPVRMGGSSAQNVSALREDLESLNASVLLLQETVTDIDASQKNLSIEQEDFARRQQDISQAQQYISRNVDELMARPVQAPGQASGKASGQTAGQAGGRAGNSSESFNSNSAEVVKLSNQVKENSKVLANVLVKSSVNDARIGALEEAPLVGNNGAGVASTDKKLVEQVKANSTVLSNILVKSSVNEARIITNEERTGANEVRIIANEARIAANETRMKEIEQSEKLSKDYTKLIEQVKNNSRAIVSVMAKSSGSTATMKEVNTLKTDFSQLVSRLNTNSKILANVTIKSAVNDTAIKELQTLVKK
jgi:hypothetical protein